MVAARDVWKLKWMSVSVLHVGGVSLGTLAESSENRTPSTSKSKVLNIFFVLVTLQSLISIGSFAIW